MLTNCESLKHANENDLCFSQALQVVNECGRRAEITDKKMRRLDRRSEFSNEQAAALLKEFSEENARDVMSVKCLYGKSEEEMTLFSRKLISQARYPGQALEFARWWNFTLGIESEYGAIP